VRNREDAFPDEDRPFWKQRGWLVSAAFLALILVAGSITVIVSSPEGNGASRPGAISGPLTTKLPAGATRPADCRTDDRDQQPPTRPPADVTWRMLNGANIPVSAGAGPLREYGSLLWCFAHTPMGAVMAANIVSRYMSGNDWKTAVDQQILPGVGRDVFAAKRASITTTNQQYTANSIAGFTVLSYSPATATVRLLIRQPDNSYVATSLTVVWDNGDWKLEPSPDGQLYTTVSRVADATGFVMWSV
jgi:hypothetical protein